MMVLGAGEDVVSVQPLTATWIVADEAGERGLYALEAHYRVFVRMPGTNGADELCAYAVSCVADGEIVSEGELEGLVGVYVAATASDAVRIAARARAARRPAEALRPLASADPPPDESGGSGC